MRTIDVMASTREVAHLIGATMLELYAGYVGMSHQEVLENVRELYETPSQADVFADDLATRIKAAIVDIGRYVR